MTVISEVVIIDNNEDGDILTSRSNSSYRVAAQNVLNGAFIGVLLGVILAYIGEVRVTFLLLVFIFLICTVAGTFRVTRHLLNVIMSLIALILVLCLFTNMLKKPLNALVINQAPAKADAIVVLGGSVQCGSHSLESSSLTRLTKGLELWRAGYASLLTVSEQSGLIGDAQCPKMSGLEQEYIQALYPINGPKVLTLKNVTTTRDEVARVKEYAQQRGWKKVIMVTTPTHSKRALGWFKQAGIETISVNAPETRFDMTLPLASDRLAALKTVSYEWTSRLKAGAGGTPQR